MPLPFNWPGESATLQKLFGLKGRVPLQMDEMVVPVAIIANGEASPWASSINVAKHRNQAAGGAGVESGIMVRPGGGVVLSIEKVVVDNNQASAIRCDLRMLSPALIATPITVVASSNMNNMQAPINPDGSIGRTGSLVSSVTHTAVIGDVLWRINVAANDSKQFQLPVPFFLDGDANGGVGGLVLWNLADDQVIGATFIGREYPNRA